MSVSRKVALLRPTTVNSILQEVRALQAEGRELVSLMRGEPDFRTPEHIVEAAVRALRDGRTGYPDNRGESALREAVAERLRRDLALEYDPGREVLVTTGATFGIHAALMALIDDGDGVLVPDPIYDAYASVIRLAGGHVQPVRAVLENGRFRLPVASLESARTKASRVLLLNTPWNPTGTVLREDELREIVQFVERANLTVVSDEIYDAITYDGRVHRSIAGVSPEMRERCVVVNSFSKTYAMTGWRVGYCAAPEKLISAMFLVLQQSSRGPATFVQDAAAAALSGPQDCVRCMREEYAARRATVAGSLRGLAHTHVIEPEGGFFAMVDVRASGLTSDAVRKRLLHDGGVVVVHGAAYGEAGEGTLRASFAGGGAKFECGLERLRKGLEAI